MIIIFIHSSLLLFLSFLLLLTNLVMWMTLVVSLGRWKVVTSFWVTSQSEVGRCEVSDICTGRIRFITTRIKPWNMSEFCSCNTRFSK